MSLIKKKNSNTKNSLYNEIEKELRDYEKN